MFSPRHGRSWLFAILVLLAATMAAGDERQGRDDDLLQHGESLYSQGNEELIIRHFFNDQRQGFFVDVGSFHWKRLSTTYYLEKHLDWSGIAIDANPRFRETYEKNRPRTRFFSYIVTDHSGTSETLYIPKGADGVASTSRNWVTKFFDWRHPGRDPNIREVTVPTITLNELLDQHEVDRIDLLSMDIEGGEPGALAGFDIRRFRTRLVCVEATSTNRGKLSAYFRQHRYERIDEYLQYDQVNWYYRPVKGEGD